MRNLDRGQAFLDSKISILNDRPLILADRKIELQNHLKAPCFVIDGVIPDGVGVIAGSAGIGKTTGIIPLAAVAAGFSSHLSDIKSKRRRHVILLTEDHSQASRLFYGMTEWMVLDDGKKVSIEDLSEWVHLYSSTRLSTLALRNNLREASAFTNTIKRRDGTPLEIAPLVIIDTAAANFDLTNENSNAEISAFMAVLKEIHTKTGMSIWVIAHLAKTAKGASIDEMDSLSARGGGAWEADANWTAVLSADDDGKRILKMNKRRVELTFNEIYFQSITHSKVAIDEYGDELSIEYRYVTPMRSDYGTRVSQKLEPLKEKILRTVSKLEWPSKNEIQIEMGGKSTKLKNLIDSMIERNDLFEAILPPNQKRKGRKTYIAVQSDGKNESIYEAN